MLRLDVVHPVISGNKWYKLKYNIAFCKKKGIDTILSFGGAYSNHLSATAAAAKLSEIRSIGIIKGTYAKENLTPTLQSCIEYGMQLVFVSNEDYRRKNEFDYLNELAERYGNPFIIPEGGANDEGREGAGEIAALIPAGFSHVAVSVGTGSTLCGIVNNVQEGVHVAGFAPMKGGNYLNDEIRTYISQGRRGQYRVYDNWHFGGFGKHTEEQLSFMNQFYKLHNIPLDVVYTSKMMYGLREQIEAGVYPAEARILCVHTGGLQGNASIADALIY